MITLRDKTYENVRLIFHEDEHKYNDTDGNDYISVTTILGNYKTKFDKEYWLKRKAKELRISVKELEKQWESIKNEACERGTNTHNNLEDNIKLSSMFKKAVKYMIKENGEMITVADIPNIDMNVRQLDIKEFIENTENKYPEIYKLFNYYTERDYKIYSEIGMFLPKWRISGTIDILCLREDSCVIGDWKTNRGGLKFTAGYYKKDKSTKPAQTTNIWVPKSEFLLPPLNNLPACNGSVYNMQLSLYAFGVEWILGIPCRGMWLCHIDSDFELNKYGMPKRFEDGLYHIKENPVEKCTIHPMKYLREEVLGILKDRETVLQAENITKELNLFD